jgi:hypothetical protein
MTYVILHRHGVYNTGITACYNAVCIMAPWFMLCSLIRQYSFHGQLSRRKLVEKCVGAVWRVGVGCGRRLIDV